MTDATSTNAAQESAPVSPVVRVLSGAGAVFLSLLGLVVSLGAILGAPLGIWLVERWIKRHNRRPSGLASLFSAVFSSALLAALLWSVLFALAPRPDQSELKSAVAQRQGRPAVKLPDWYFRAFPQAAQADSAAQVFSDSVVERMARSPAFPKLIIAVGVMFLAMGLGTIGGVTGWGAHRLYRLAAHGRRIQVVP